MKKHKWKKLSAIAITIITAIAGINLNIENPIHNKIPEITYIHKTILRINETYILEDGTQVQIKTSPLGYWVIFTPN